MTPQEWLRSRNMHLTHSCIICQQPRLTASFLCPDHREAWMELPDDRMLAVWVLQERITRLIRMIDV